MPQREERLAEAARLYYVEGLTQSDVAARLDTTRSNVSRLLAAARREGVIRFHITHPLGRQQALEQSIEETFGVDEAVVLAADTTGDPLERVTELAARWLAGRVRDGQRITVSWGRTLARVAAHVHVDRAYDVEVVQIGGELHLEPHLSGHELVRELAARLGGQYSYLHAPAVLDSPTTVATLRSHHSIAAELEKARAADLALVGVGGFGHGFAAQILRSAHLDAGSRDSLASLNPAGDIAARFYDEAGRELDSPLAHRVLGLSLEEVQAIPVVVGVLAGEQKARAAWSAMRGGLLDVLICDQAAAASALHHARAAAPSGEGAPDPAL